MSIIRRRASGAERPVLDDQVQDIPRIVEQTKADRTTIACTLVVVSWHTDGTTYLDWTPPALRAKAS